MHLKLFLIISLSAFFSQLSLAKQVKTIDLRNSSKWETLKYRNIPANTVQHNENGMHIHVDASASPLIYKFKHRILLKTIEAKGHSNAQFLFEKGNQQGDNNNDDYALRLGLIVAGNKKLGFTQKLLAPAWLKTLFSMAPKSTGIKHIYFLNLGSETKHLKRIRKHPLSDLMLEEIVSIQNQKHTSFKLKKTFTHTLEILGL